jgi:hypothetical protein
MKETCVILFLICNLASLNSAFQIFTVSSSTSAQFPLWTHFNITERALQQTGGIFSNVSTQKLVHRGNYARDVSVLLSVLPSINIVGVDQAKYQIVNAFLRKQVGLDASVPDLTVEEFSVFKCLISCSSFILIRSTNFTNMLTIPIWRTKESKQRKST